ncbi:terminase large subunit domain-containing protein [Thermocrinis sp.]|jgi:phage FluMu gp28-like protein|uniref:terminase large subunit domain-containing protein n=1 Tax=Thermocrinis sp. TaxID=2024383 RepID=UPI003C1097B3
MEFEKLLLPYQRYALQKMLEKKYSILMWSRQTGKSFVVSLFAVFRAIERKNHLVAIISPTERQSKELMEKVKRHVEFLRQVGKLTGDVEFFEDTQTNVLEVRFPNRSRIIGLPANPDGVRGLTGDVILEEAAFFKDGYKVYQAIFPSITRNQDFKLVVISTPKAKNDIFGHLWQMSEGNDLWFRQKLTIYDAVSLGLDVDVEELRKGVPNQDIWLQEYMCEFLDEESVLLPYELIHACTVEGIEADIRELTGDVYLGVDIGRRHDLTVISILEKVAGRYYLRKQEILRKLPFSEQFQIIDHLTAYARKVAIDETGIGMQLAEELAKKWGELKVLRVYFTAKAKEELASRVKAVFEDKIISIPPDKDLIEDLHSVKRTLTPAGNIRYEGETQDSHADRFWSLALALYASSQEETKEFLPVFFANQKRELSYGLNTLL